MSVVIVIKLKLNQITIWKSNYYYLVLLKVLQNLDCTKDISLVKKKQQQKNWCEFLQWNMSLIPKEKKNVVIRWSPENCLKYKSGCWLTVRPTQRKILYFVYCTPRPEIRVFLFECFVKLTDLSPTLPCQSAPLLHWVERPQHLPLGRESAGMLCRQY